MKYAYFKIAGLDSLKTQFPGDLVVNNPPVNAGDSSSIPVSGISPGEGNGNPL